MSPDDTLHTDVPGNRLKTYLLLDADRWIVTGGILGLTFVVVSGLVAIDPVPLERAIASSDPVETLFQAMVTAIVTGVTLVVSINSLVISQELGAVGDQRKRMSGSLDFRDDAADAMNESVSPMRPSTFLRALLTRIRERATDLERATADVSDPEVRQGIESYADSVIDDADEGRSDLEGREFGTFGVISAALDFGYSVHIREGKRLLREHDESLDDAAIDAFYDVLQAMELFAPAREHVKTLYVQWELVNLSRAIIYAAIPALIVSVSAVLTLDNPGSIQGATFGVANVSWVIVAAATVSLAPFAVLLSYILRIGTVIKRTLAIGPFVLRDVEGDTENE